MKQKTLLLTLLTLTIHFTFGQTNQYLHFDRVDDYVRLDDGSQYIANTNEFAMAGWFYTDQLAYGQGMLGFRGTSQGFYLIQLSNGKLESRLITDAGFHEVVGPDFTILPGQWQHVAWVYNSTHVILYIDGVAKDSVAASGQITATDIPFTIGRSILTNLNFYFGGRVDELTVWDRAISASEIQNMMANEPTGTEPGLQLYYKFNQGQPGGDNTAITKLVSETGSGERDADLIGFAMNGMTSNFEGTLQVGFQAISFSEIPNKLISDAPFVLDAVASSGLPVQFQIVSGPATISGDTLTLDGTEGVVVVEATQPGDTTYTPASPVIKSFNVIDPMTTLPNLDLRNPLPGAVYVPTLRPIQLAAIANTDFSELLNVVGVEFEINGEVIKAKDWNNEHYTAWWTPPSHNMFDLTVRAMNDFGAVESQTVPIIITDSAISQEIVAFENVWINSTVFSQEVEANLLGFVGAFDSISAKLQVTCPPGGCGPWDRVAKVEAKTHEGVWFEMIRYITPYGVACGHTLDVTDFMSALQGKITFRVSSETFDNGFSYKLNFDYHAGTPDYPYTKISPVWHETFPFGDPANLTPVDPKTVSFPENAEASKFKLVSSGHGWGANNTSNAAEFFETTHFIHIDNAPAFGHYNWQVCNPNPDGCQPQNGTWFHNRAGFCPGAISPWFDFDMTNQIAKGSILLDYILDPNYQDECHPNNPNCITGVTCDNCNDGFNPHLIVGSSMIHYSNAPFDSSTTNIENLVEENKLNIYPNPSSGRVEVALTRPVKRANLVVFNTLGMELKRMDNVDFSNQNVSLDLSFLPSGMYLIVLEEERQRSTRTLYLVR
jgi:hypothetical protein